MKKINIMIIASCVSMAVSIYFFGNLYFQSVKLNKAIRETAKQEKNFHDSLVVFIAKVDSLNNILKNQ